MGMTREEYEVRRSIELQRQRSRTNFRELLSNSIPHTLMVCEPTDAEVLEYSGLDRKENRELFAPKSSRETIWWMKHPSFLYKFFNIFGSYTFEPDDFDYGPPPPPPPKKFLAYANSAKDRDPRESEIKVCDPDTPEGPPDYTHYLTGYRAWRVLGSKRLWSLGQSFSWPAMKPFEASCCEVKDHECPNLICGCGIWAFREIEVLVDALEDYDEEKTIIGTVALWGNVVETEKGWRAQFAYPLELWLKNPNQEPIASRYGCRVREAY